MTTAVKRARASKGRDKRWLQFIREITGEWMQAIRHQRPITETHAKISARITALDVQSYQRADLMARHWGARDIVVCAYAEWVLYLAGKPTTPEERSRFSHDQHKQLRGRFEWRGTGKPFYDNAEPQLLWNASRINPTKES